MLRVWAKFMKRFSTYTHMTYMWLVFLMSTWILFPSTAPLFMTTLMEGNIFSTTPTPQKAPRRIGPVFNVLIKSFSRVGPLIIQGILCWSFISFVSRVVSNYDEMRVSSAAVHNIQQTRMWELNKRIQDFVLGSVSHSVCSSIAI